MTEIAKYVRIFEPSPTDDFVDKRKKAIDTIEAGLKKKRNVSEILKLCNDLIMAIGSPNTPVKSVTDEAEAALKKQSASFVAEGQQLQILTCTMIAVVVYLEKVKTTTATISVADVIGIGLWSGLSFQIPISSEERLEQLRMELLVQAQRLLNDSSVQARQRKKVVIPTITQPSDGTPSAIINSIEKPYKEAIDALMTNAVLDREETDVLWWLLSEWSEIAKCSFANMNAAQKAIVAGIEISSILRRVPGQTHRNLVSKFTEESELIDGSQLIDALGGLLPEIVKVLSANNDIVASPFVFPLFTMLINGKVSSGTESVKRPLSEWAHRALLEGIICNLNRILTDGQ